MYRFEKLVVWQKAMDLIVEVYAESQSYPADERFGLTSQTRRAVNSIALNVAEGSACRSRKEFVQFLSVSLRSQYELATALRVAVRLNYLNADAFTRVDSSTARVGRLLQGLIDSIRREVSGVGDASVDPDVEADVVFVLNLLTEP
jgi:four helix bundle protein